MKLQKTTWLLVVLAVVLGGWVYFYEIKSKQNQVALKADRQQLFNFPEEAIAKITITKPEQTLEFVKTENEMQPWQMKQPQNAPASDAAVAFLVDLLVNGKSDRTFTSSTAQLAQYGLNQPMAQISIELNQGKAYTISLGKPTLNNQLLYAQIGSSSETESETEVVLVPINWQYAVERELEEWQQQQSVTE